MPLKTLIFIFPLAWSLVGCGGSGSSSPPPSDPDNTEEQAGASGYLFDSPVAGMAYESGELSGVTNSQGRFQHESGQLVTFSYAGLMLGQVTLQESGEVVTPIELQAVARENYANDEATVNLLRLLQTLDSDGDLATGIDLYNVDGSEAEEALAALILNDPNFDSAAQAAIDTIVNTVSDDQRTLVEAEEAIGHFEQTLEYIEVEQDQRNHWLAGTWEYRTEQYGEVAGKLTLDAAGSGTMEEYENCGGTGAAAWLATTSRAAAICDDAENFDISWTLEGRTLILDAGEFTDTCTIISGDQHAFSTDCQISVANGTANEYQEFIRIEVGSFDERLVPGTYREFDSEGSHDFSDTTTSTLRTDGTGEYLVHSNGDSGTFDWEVSIDGSELQLNIDGEMSPVIQTFQHYFAGAVEAVEGNSFLIIPNYSGWNAGEMGVQRYSIPDGTPISSPTSAAPLAASGTGEVEIFLEDGTMRLCRPLHRMPTSETNDGPVYWMACNGTADEGTGGEFFYEIWRTTL